MAASVCSFSFSSSSDEKPIPNSDKTAVKPSDSDTKNTVEVSAKMPSDSGTITNDPKEAADSADSGFKVPTNSSKKTGKPQILLFLFICFLIHLSILLPLHTYNDFFIRSIFQGPSEFHVHSASLSAFSTSSWRSQQITADGNISLSAKNILLREKIIYDFMEVSVFQNNTLLSSNVLMPFSQVPGNKSQLNVNFSAKIDAAAVADFVKPDDSVSLDIVIRGTVCNTNHAKQL